MERLINSEVISDTGIHFSTGVLLDSFINDRLFEKYDNWLINIETIIRNFIDNMDGNTEYKIKFLKRKDYKIMLEELLSDIDIMYSQIPEDFNLTFYYLDYSKIKNNLASYKQDDDFKGLKYYVYIYQDIIIKKLKESLDIIMVKHNKLPKLDNTLITTHIPADLLNFKYKKNIGLFESFTAVIKDNDKWYTKYKSLKDKDMSIIPFIEPLYIIFGDNWRIKPTPVKTRLKIYNIAIKYHWNFKTGKIKVIQNVTREDQFLGKAMKDIMMGYD